MTTVVSLYGVADGERPDASCWKPQQDAVGVHQDRPLGGQGEAENLTGKRGVVAVVRVKRQLQLDTLRLRLNAEREIDDKHATTIATSAHMRDSGIGQPDVHRSRRGARSMGDTELSAKQ